MTNTPEFKLLTATLRSLGGGPDVRATGKEDAEVLVQLAIRHGMAALLVRQLPEGHPARDKLVQVAALARVRSMAVSGALLEISSEFNRRGIRHIQFKGPSTAVRLYNDVGLRPFLDLDLLVAPRDVSEAHEAVKGLGFNPDRILKSGYLPYYGGKNFSQMRGATRLELHRRLLATSGAERFDTFEDFWDRRDTYELGGSQVACLSRSDTIYQACLHGTGHGFLSLKWLADVVLMAGWESDWDDALEKAERCNLRPAFLCGPAMAGALGCQLPTVVQEKIQAPSRKLISLTAISWAMAVQNEGGEFAIVVQSFRMLPGLRQVKAAAQLLLKPAPSDWDLVPWLSPGVPLVFEIIRPFRVGAKFGLRALRKALPS